jgi:hypothetical protein
MTSMIRLPYAVLLSLLWLTLFASSASAECAWVLWVEEAALHAKYPTPRWRTVTGMATESTCYQFLKELLDQRRREPGYKVMDFTTTYDPPHDELKRFVATYSCLPDSVDPRGPKGK